MILDDQAIKGNPAGADAYIRDVVPEQWQEIPCPPPINLASAWIDAESWIDYQPWID